MSAKDIILKPINSKIANAFVKLHHYSGKVVQNSQLHFGVFYKDQLWGIMSFGPSTDKSKLIDLVAWTKWNEFIELNRMAFSEFLPKNSESRAISIALMLIKRQAPHIKWVISFADGTQCWDGTIYRAAGFDLSWYKVNKGLVELPNGEVVHKLNFTDGGSTWQKKMNLAGFTSVKKYLDSCFPGWKFKEGFMLRYIKVLDPENLKFRTYKPLPYSTINEIGAGMYKGKRKEV